MPAPDASQAVELSGLTLDQDLHHLMTQKPPLLTRAAAKCPDDEVKELQLDAEKEVLTGVSFGSTVKSYQFGHGRSEEVRPQTSTMQNKDYPERRATLLFCFFAVFVAVGFVGWCFLPRPSYWQLLSQTPETAGAYFTNFHRGEKQSQVEDWLAFNRLEIECSERFRLGETIYVRVKTKPETLLAIEFDHERFGQAYSFLYEGVCPPKHLTVF